MGRAEAALQRSPGPMSHRRNVPYERKTSVRINSIARSRTGRQRVAAALVTLPLIGLLSIAPTVQAATAPSGPAGKSSQDEPLPTVVIPAGVSETVVVTGDGVTRFPDQNPDDVMNQLMADVGAQTEEEVLGADGYVAWASAGRPVTEAELAQIGDTVVDQHGMTFADLADVGVLSTRSWSQRGPKFSYPWHEVHTGRLYYDNRLTARHDAHVCDQGDGVGFSIRVTSCFEENSTSGMAARAYDYFQVHAIADPVPIYASHWMYVKGSTTGVLGYYDNGKLGW